MHPVLIRLGPLSLPTYGVLVAAGYLTAILWLKRQLGFMRLTEDQFWKILYGVFAGAILGGKFLYLLVEYKAVASGELGIFRDFRYGFVFFGGFLGAVLLGGRIARRVGDFRVISDYFMTALPLGHAIGRLGCLAAGCCFGRPTRLPWGISLGGHPESITPSPLWGIPLHPTQIYESLGNAVVFLFLSRSVLPRVRGGKLPTGSAFLGYTICYSFLRFVVEFFRGDDRGLLAGLSTSQWIAAAAFAASVALLTRFTKI